MHYPLRPALLGALIVLTGCAHFGLLRPNRLKQLNTRVVNLVNELPRVDGFAPELYGAPRGHALVVFTLP